MLSINKSVLTRFTIISIVAILGFLIFLQYSQKDKEASLTPTLKSLAKEKGISLGNFAIYNHIYEKQYSDILTSQFDFVLADNTPNWYFTDGGMRPSRTEYNFSQLDDIVKYGKENNMYVQSHHYVWGEEKWLPSWLKDGNYTPQEIKDIMKEHILTVGGHYKGQIKEWTVVNEAFTRNMHLYGLRDWWTDAIGDDSYIDESFKWAREADPEAILIHNDFGNESINDVSNVMYEYIKSAKERGIPIDGIGMQMHIDGTHPPMKDEVISNMRRFAELGVGVYVTEFDVNMNDVIGTSKHRNEIEGNIYYEMMRACIESKVCHSFAFLGITDSETWYNYMNIPDARPLMFDKDYNPKPAYYGVKRALEEK